MAQGGISVRAMNCCGIQEVHGISGHEYRDDPARALLHIVTGVMGLDVRNYVPKTAFLLFSQASAYSVGSRQQPIYGEKLRDYILQEKLGTVTQSPEARNPNSNNYVTVFLWEIDRVAVTEWLLQKGIV